MTGNRKAGTPPALPLRKNPHPRLTGTPFCGKIRTMLDAPFDRLSRRERQIMEIIYAVGSASAADVQGNLADAPGYSAVRSALRLLEKKGLLVHRREGLRYVFEPKMPGEHAKKGALRRVVTTFFRNSALEAVQALLSDKDLRLSEPEIEEIEKLLKGARKRK